MNRAQTVSVPKAQPKTVSLLLHGTRATQGLLEVGRGQEGCAAGVKRSPPASPLEGDSTYPKSLSNRLGRASWPITWTNRLNRRRRRASTTMQERSSGSGRLGASNALSGLPPTPQRPVSRFTTPLPTREGGLREVTRDCGAARTKGATGQST